MSEIWVQILIALVSVGVTILLFAIPWAYKINGRLTSIETHVTNVLPMFQALQERVHRLEIDQARREGPE